MLRLHMAYNEQLANRVRERLLHLNEVEEKEMMGGIAFMYNGKMCVGVIKDELMCRIGPAMYEDALEKTGCRAMDLTGRRMKGWVLVDQYAITSNKDIDHWINLAIDFNKHAKKSKKK